MNRVLYGKHVTCSTRYPLFIKRSNFELANATQYWSKYDRLLCVPWERKQDNKTYNELTSVLEIHNSQLIAVVYTLGRKGVKDRQIEELSE